MTLSTQERYIKSLKSLGITVFKGDENKYWYIPNPVVLGFVEMTLLPGGLSRDLFANEISAVTRVMIILE